MANESPFDRLGRAVLPDSDERLRIQLVPGDNPFKLAGRELQEWRQWREVADENAMDPMNERDFRPVSSEFVYSFESVPSGGDPEEVNLSDEWDLSLVPRDASWDLAGDYTLYCEDYEARTGNSIALAEDGGDVALQVLDSNGEVFATLTEYSSATWEEFAGLAWEELRDHASLKGAGYVARRYGDTITVTHPDGCTLQLTGSGVVQAVVSTPVVITGFRVWMEDSDGNYGERAVFTEEWVTDLTGAGRTIDLWLSTPGDRHWLMLEMTANTWWLLWVGHELPVRIATEQNRYFATVPTLALPESTR